MSTHEISSEISGTVWQVRVRPGDKVEPGDELLIIESMKMEIPVLADGSGTVDSVYAEQGATVAENQLVISLLVDEGTT